MANEEKSLLLKDLCARLPYAVKYKTYLGDVFTLKDITFSKTTTEYYIDDNAFSVDQIKPFLRPMSSMTEEEFDEFSDIIIPVDSGKAIVQEEKIHKYIDFCNTHHFDWNGLIEKGIALEAPEGMYKT